MNIKKNNSQIDREAAILTSLINLYIKTGKPIGSNTLKENGFSNLSSATIRNHLVNLENNGFLHQTHTSGGRTPTNTALKCYALQQLEDKKAPNENIELSEKLEWNGKDLFKYLQKIADIVSKETKLATALSSVRFDHDLISNVKLVYIDKERFLSVIVTDFGQIWTEIFYSNQDLHEDELKNIELFIINKINGTSKNSKNKEPFNKRLALSVYNEIIVRYLVRYSNFSKNDIYKTGLSNLISYPEFNDPISLSSSLSLFENNAGMNQILKECVDKNKIIVSFGEDLSNYCNSVENIVVITAPYRIGSITVGSIAVLGSNRIPYKNIYEILETVTDKISESLTANLTKFKLSFRNPNTQFKNIENNKKPLFITVAKNYK